MKCLNRRIVVESDWNNRRVGLFVFSDIHLGSIATDEKKLEKDIEGVKHRGDYWIDLGDSLECINRKDRRHKEESVAPWLQMRTDVVHEQMERYKELFSDIRHQCVAKLKGNHEESYLVHQERDVHQRLVEWIKDGIGDDSIHIDGGIQTHIRMGFAGQKKTDGKGYGRTAVLKIFAGHGYGGGRKAGAGPLSLEYLMGIHNVDVLFTGHRHRPSFHQQFQIDTNKAGRITERYRIGFVVPSYRSKLLNEFPSKDVAVPDYSDVKLFPPSMTGGVRIEFDVAQNTLLNPFRSYE